MSTSRRCRINKLKAAAVAAAAGSVAVAACLSAGTANAAPSDPTIGTHYFADGRGAADYWTPDRMRSAKPADGNLISPPDKASSKPDATGPVAGTPRAIPGSKGVDRADPARPVPTVGKIFFTVGDKHYVCSGNSVTAKNKSLVSTAGHCVVNRGVWHSNWIFVPAYENGKAPYGIFPAVSASAPNQWINNGQFAYDTAFVKMAPVNGRTLADTVGTGGIGFNQPRGLNYTAYGYPAAKPFNGETLYTCSGRAGNSYGDLVLQSCDMTEGSSGGPWISNSIQSSVNSYGYPGYLGMYGPYWGQVIEKAYNTAEG